MPHDNTNDTNFIATTPAGFSYLTTWGSARYNAAAQLEALAYRKNFPTDPQSVLFSDWAMGQMNYLMGDNPAKWSYIVGFGSTTPGIGSQVGGTATAASHPHHGDAQGSLTNSQSDPPTDRHILFGALVGGPSSTDQPDDVTTDFVLNEVAVDYNAAFVGRAGRALPVLRAEPDDDQLHPARRADGHPLLRNARPSTRTATRAPSSPSPSTTWPTNRRTSSPA